MDVVSLLEVSKICPAPKKVKGFRGQSYVTTEAEVGMYHHVFKSDKMHFT